MTNDDKKRISLLIFALNKSKRPEICIRSLESPELSPRLDDNFYIEYNRNGLYDFGYGERGIKRNIAQFSKLRDAIDYAYFSSFDYEDKINFEIYKYREEWERVTGLSF